MDRYSHFQIILKTAACIAIPLTRKAAVNTRPKATDHLKQKSAILFFIFEIPFFC